MRWSTIRSSCISIHTSWNEPHITPVNAFVSPAATLAADSSSRGEYRAIRGSAVGEPVDRRRRVGIELRQPGDALGVVGSVGVVVLRAAAHLPVGAQLLEDLVQLEELLVVRLEPGRTSAPAYSSISVSWRSLPGGSKPYMSRFSMWRT